MPVTKSAAKPATRAVQRTNIFELVEGFVDNIDRKNSKSSKLFFGLFDHGTVATHIKISRYFGVVKMFDLILDVAFSSDPST